MDSWWRNFKRRSILCSKYANRGSIYSPKKDEVNGIVYSSKPFCYGGNLIENFYLKFKDGKVVEAGAEKGEETLIKLLDSDDGARYLGEVALVP